MSDIDKIVAFLTACHDEDERIAQQVAAAVDAGGPRYSWDDIAGFIVDDYTDSVLEAGHYHAGRHTPASILIRLDAERAIVTAYRERQGEYLRDLTDGEVDGLGIAVQALAFGYRGRDGFDSSWFDHPWGPL